MSAQKTTSEEEKMQNILTHNYSPINANSQYENINILSENTYSSLDALHDDIWERWINRKQNGANIDMLLSDVTTHTLKNYANFLRMKAKMATFNSISLHFDLIKFRCKVLDIIAQRDRNGNSVIGYRW